MGKAIVEGMVPVLIGAFTLWAVLYYRRKKHQETLRQHGWAEKGDLNRRQEAKLIAINTSAAQIMSSLLTPNYDLLGADSTLLSRVDRERITGWLTANRTALSTTSSEGIHE